MTYRKAKIFIIIIWLVSLASVPIFIVFMNSGDILNACGLSPFTAVIINLCCSFIPMCVIFFLQFQIYKIARRHRRRVINVETNRDNQQSETALSRATMKKELRSIKTFLVIIGALVGCLAPVTVLTIVQILLCNSLHCLPPELFLAFGDLVGVNSIVNPCIYGIRQKEYYSAFRRWILFGSG